MTAWLEPLGPVARPRHRLRIEGVAKVPEPRLGQLHHPTDRSQLEQRALHLVELEQHIDTVTHSAAAVFRLLAPRPVGRTIQFRSTGEEHAPNLIHP